MSLPQNNLWSVPREWPGERCLIIAGGESVKGQEALIKAFQGRVIAVKQSVALRPDADVMFIAGKDDGKVCAPFFDMHRGKYLIARGNYKGVPSRVKVLGRTLIASHLSDDPHEVAGLDAGTSSINLAYLFGASEIVLLGYDMTGGRWLNGKYPHHLPFPPKEHFRLHMEALAPIAKALTDRGIKVFNCSPISAVTCFEKRNLEAFV